jgi:tetratricopeptide (TPR) repeat protein
MASIATRMSIRDFLFNPPLRAFKNAQKAIREKRYEDALPLLDIAKKSVPSHYHYYYLKGVAYQQLNRLDEALVEYDAAHSLRPDHGATLHNRGIIHQKQSQLDRAMDDFNKAIKCGFNSYSGRAYVRLLQNDLQGARLDIEKGLELSPANISVLLLKFHIFRRLDQHSEAALAVERVLEIDPFDRTANNNLAWLLATCHCDELRNGRRALSCALKAIGDEPNPPLAYIGTLAAAYAENGRFEDAQKWAALFLERNPPEENRGPALARLDLYRRRLPFREQAGKAETVRDTRI